MQERGASSSFPGSTDGPTPVSPWSTPLLVGYVLICTVHLLLSGLHLHLAASITKCFVAPMLMLWVGVQRPAGGVVGPRLLLVALFFCFLGDLFLELPSAFFLAGMGAFAIGHICFVRMFVQRGALETLRRRPYIVLGYLCAAGGVLGWCWGGLPSGIKPAVPLYACLLVSMASTSLGASSLTGLGGGIFLASDGIILLNQGSRINEETAPWRPDIILMLLYIIALVLLAYGTIVRERASATFLLGARGGAAALHEADPALRAQCWPRIPPGPNEDLDAALLESQHPTGVLVQRTLTG